MLTPFISFQPNSQKDYLILDPLYDEEQQHQQEVVHGKEKEFEREGAVGDNDNAPRGVSWDSHEEGTLQDQNSAGIIL